MTEVGWNEIYGAMGEGIRAQTIVDTLKQVIGSNEFNVWDKVNFSKAVLGIKVGEDDAARNDH